MGDGSVHILSGLESILNPDNIKSDINLADLERQMISGGIMQPVKVPDKFNEDLQEAAAKLGISFGSPKKKMPVASTPWPKPLPPSPPPEEEEDNYIVEEIMDKTPRRDSLYSRTLEQERRSHIDAVMGPPETGSFSFESEKREDMKCAMLAEIDSITATLEAGGDVDISRLPRVDRNSDYAEIEAALKMFRHKNDHTRYCIMAEEFLLFGAYALEELFDGKRTWFGSYQPDLTGWHNTVNMKMRRMRHDTGQIVSGIMQEFNIGPTARLLVELIPNMILYSKTRKQQHGQPGLFNDEDMQHASQNLRDLDI